MVTLYDAEGNGYEVDDSLFNQQDPPVDDGPKSNSDFAALRKQTQATKAAEKAADDARREAAFLRAGIDPEAKEGMAPYFVSGYKGELTKEAIQAAALAAGILRPAEQTPQEQAAALANQESLNASARVAGVANAGMAAPQGDEVFQQAMADAYTAGGIEAMTAVLESRGIPRVTH